jgi:hypothetical protein
MFFEWKTFRRKIFTSMQKFGVKSRRKQSRKVSETKLTFSSFPVKQCSPPNLFITCATPTTSPEASFIGMHSRALVLYPVCTSTSRLKRSSCNKVERENIKTCTSLCAVKQHELDELPTVINSSVSLKSSFCKLKLAVYIFSQHF